MDSIVQAAKIGGSVYLAGMGTQNLIPIAMSAFGTVLPGVGTIHAAGGVAAFLQSAAAAATLSNSILIGASTIPITYIRSKL